MKKFLSTLLFFFALFTCFSQAYIGSDGAVHPTGAFPVALSNEIKGSPKWAADLLSRDAIPPVMRERGMLCYVISSSTLYYLDQGITNGDWRTFGSSVATDSALTEAINQTQWSIQQVLNIGNGFNRHNKFVLDSFRFALNVGSGSVAVAHSNIGVITNPSASQLPVAAALGVKDIRSGVMLTTTAQSQHVSLSNAGYEVHPTVNWKPFSAMDASGAFPTAAELSAYTAAFVNYLDNKVAGYDVKLLTFENEENNMNYRTAIVADYIALMQTVIPLAHNRGYLVANGGLTGPYLKRWVWKWLTTHSRSAEAAAFAAREWGTGEIANLGNWESMSNKQRGVAIVDSLIAYYTTSGQDYVNFHFYGPGAADTTQAASNGAASVALIADVIFQATGKKAICDELGQHNSDSALVRAQLAACAAINMPYVFWYSGNGNHLNGADAVALHNTDNSLRPNGISFQSWLTAYNANISTTSGGHDAFAWDKWGMYLYDLKKPFTLQTLKLDADGKVYADTTFNMPYAAKINQLLWSDGAGSNRYVPADEVFYGKIIYTDAQLDSMKVNKTAQSDIFKKWKRYAHGGISGTGNSTVPMINDTIPNPPNQTNSWSYNTTTGLIKSTMNSGANLGMVNDNIFSQSYSISATVSSTNKNDNDLIGLVIAYYEDNTVKVRNNAYQQSASNFNWPINVKDSLIPRQYTISVMRNRGSPLTGYVVLYNAGLADQDTIYNGTSLMSYKPTSNWDSASTETDIKVVRSKDTITIWTTEFADAPGGKGALGHQISFLLTSKPSLLKFRNGSSFGFCVRSQSSAYYKNFQFSDFTQNIYDLRSGAVWVPLGGVYAVDSSLNAYSIVGPRKLWRNPYLTSPTFGWTYDNGTYDVISNASGTSGIAQVNSDWNASSGVAQILNKPTIPAAQVNSDWNASSGVQQILNKPTIPAAQVNSDWNASSGVQQILNKPTIPAAQVNSDWNASSGVAQVFNKPTIPAQVNLLQGPYITISGTYPNLTITGTAPGSFTQLNSDWNASSGVQQILNKPDPILNQYLIQQAAAFRTDSGNMRHLSMGTFTYANMGAINLDSAAAAQGIYLYGDNNTKPGLGRYFRLWWSDTNNVYMTATSAAGLSKNMRFTASGDIFQSAYTINLTAGNAVVANNFRSTYATLGSALYFQGNVMSQLRYAYPGYAAANGSSTTIRAGDCTSGGGTSNLTGGPLYLSSGYSSGNGGGIVGLQTPTPGASGTSDNAPTTKLSVNGPGTVNIAVAPATSAGSYDILTRNSSSGDVESVGSGSFVPNQGAQANGYMNITASPANTVSAHLNKLKVDSGYHTYFRASNIQADNNINASNFVTSKYATIGGIYSGYTTTSAQAGNFGVKYYTESSQTAGTIHAAAKSVYVLGNGHTLSGATTVALWGLHDSYDQGSGNGGTLVGVRGDVNMHNNTAERLDGVEAKVGIGYIINGSSGLHPNGGVSWGSAFHAYAPAVSGAFPQYFQNYRAVELDSLSSPSTFVAGGADPYQFFSKGSVGIFRSEQSKVAFPNLPAYSSGTTKEVVLNSSGYLETSPMQVIGVVTGTGGTNQYLQISYNGTTYYAALSTTLPN